MAVSIDNHLRAIASDLFLGYQGEERININASIDRLKTNLTNYFGYGEVEVLLFGSYTRNTILPRRYDAESDVDVMVIFKKYNWHGWSLSGPESFRTKLKTFAVTRYASSDIRKDFPTVVLSLQHIRYDLVPAITDTWGTYYIPDKGDSWQATYPNQFNQTLTEANQRFNNIVKPVVRLLKAWNGKVNYPLPSFEMEQKIANFNFTGDNYQKGFFYAARQLNASGYHSNYVQGRLDSLVSNVQRVEDALADDNRDAALRWLGHILPS